MVVGGSMPIHVEQSYPKKNKAAEVLGYIASGTVFFSVLYWLALRRIDVIDTAGLKGYIAGSSLVILLLLVVALIKREWREGDQTVVQSFKKGAERVGKGITNLINVVVLFIVYFIGVGGTAAVAKICGKKFLNLDKGERTSYYITKQMKKESVEQYYRQF